MPAIGNPALIPNSASGTPSGQVNQSTSNKTPSLSSDFKALLAWAVFLAIVYALSRIPAGRVIIYYGLLMLILFVLLTQYQWFADALSPLSHLNPGLAPNSATDSGVADQAGSTQSV